MDMSQVPNDYLEFADIFNKQQICYKLHLDHNSRNT